MDLPVETILEAHWRSVLAKWDGDTDGYERALTEMREAADDWLRSVGRNPASREDMEFLYSELRSSGVEDAIHRQAAALLLSDPDEIRASYRPVLRWKAKKALNELTTRPDQVAV